MRHFIISVSKTSNLWELILPFTYILKAFLYLLIKYFRCVIQYLNGSAHHTGILTHRRWQLLFFVLGIYTAMSSTSNISALMTLLKIFNLKKDTQMSIYDHHHLRFGITIILVRSFDFSKNYN